jgi:hypothetical protein
MSIEVTEELVAAALKLHEGLEKKVFIKSWADTIRTILAALPEEVNPNPKLPPKPGWYVGVGLNSPVLLDSSGRWSYSDGKEIHWPALFEPLIRLVPEKPPVTWQELSDNVGGTSQVALESLADYINTRA